MKIKKLLINLAIFISIITITYFSVVFFEYLIIIKYNLSINLKMLFFKFSIKETITLFLLSTFFLCIYIHIKKCLKKNHDILQNINKENKINKSRFEKFIKMVPEGLYETDIKGRVVFASNNLVKMVGYEKVEDVIGLSIFSVLADKENYYRAKKSFLQSLKDKKTKTTNYKILTLDGIKKNIVLQVSVNLNSSGKVIGTRGIVIDSSKIVKLHENYKTNYEFLNSIIDTITFPFYFQNMKGEFKTFNRAFVKFLNKKHEDEVKFKTVFNVFPNNLSRILYKKTIDLMRSKDIQQQFQIQFNNKDYLITQKRFHNKNQKLEGGIIGIIQDISIEKKLISPEETFQIFTDNSVVGFAIINNNKISYMNNKLYKIFGYKTNEIILNDYFIKKIIHKSDLELFENILKVIKIQDHVKGSFKIRSKAGIIKKVELDLKKINHQNSDECSILVTVVDITPRIKSTQKKEAKLENL